MGGFERYLLQRGLRTRTVRGYLAAIRNAQAWCQQAGLRLDRLSAEHLADYAATKPPSWSTRKGIRTALGHWWTYIGRHDPPLWAIPVPRKPRMICRALDEDEALRWILAAERDLASDDPELIQEATAVTCMMYQALRREEVAVLRVDQFTDDGWLIVYGKGGSTDKIPLLEPTADAVLRWLRVCARPDTYVFPGRVGGHVSPTTIWTWIGRFCARHALPYAQPHRLRHTALATANDRTGDLRATAEFARHRDIQTTAGYTRAVRRRLLAVAAAIDYRAAAQEAG